MDSRCVGQLGCGLLLLLSFAIGGGLLYQKQTRTLGPEEEANSFLRLLAEGKARAAYADAAKAFRARRTAGMLTLEAKSMGLQSYAHTSWPEREIADREATLKGSVTTKHGDVIAVVVQLVREENRWRVQSFAAGPPPSESNQDTNNAPSFEGK